MLTAQSIHSLRDEIEKIAEEDGENNSGMAQVGRGLKGGLGAIAVNALGGVGTMAMGKRNIAEDSALAKKIRGGVSDVNIERHPSSMGAHFADKDWVPGKDKHVAIGEGLEHSPAILSHELGHHDISKSRVGRLLQNKGTIIAGQLSPAIGAVSGALTGLSDDERVQAAGRWAPVAAAAPMLAYEGGASLLALKRMHAAGASGRQLLRGAGTLLPAFATYGGMAALGHSAANTTQGLVRMARED